MNCIKNTVLYKEGDVCKYLYFVKSGEFQVTKKVYLPKLEEEDEEIHRLFDQPSVGRDKNNKKSDLMRTKIHVVG